MVADQIIVNKIKTLVKLLAKDNINIKKAILFGSYAKGTATETSDIDVALVSDKFEGIRYLDKQKINPYIINLDYRFEIHPYKLNEFNENKRWFVKEIIDTGIEITI